MFGLHERPLAYHLLEHINRDVKRRYSKDKDPTVPKMEYWSKSNPKVKEESKVAKHDWVDHQAFSPLQYINVIANLFIMENYFNEQR